MKMEQPPEPGDSMNRQLGQFDARDIQSDAFKSVMRNVAGAVSIVTASHGGLRAGLTATSLTALSAEPPTVIVCVNRAASAWPTIEAAGHFAINVLAARHQNIADRFAGRGGHKGEARFGEGDWGRLVTGAPTLDGALAVLDCETEEAIERHSHTILIGRIRALRHAQGEGALLYWRGVYGKLDEPLQYGAGI